VTTRKTMAQKMRTTMRMRTRMKMGTTMMRMMTKKTTMMSVVMRMEMVNHVRLIAIQRVSHIYLMKSAKVLTRQQRQKPRYPPLPHRIFAVTESSSHLSHQTTLASHPKLSSESPPLARSTLWQHPCVLLTSLPDLRMGI